MSQNGQPLICSQTVDDSWMDYPQYLRGYTNHKMKLKQNLLIAFLMLNGVLRLKAQIAQIPFEFKGAHIFIKVQTKQSDSLHFIFDTGCTGATIDSATAEKAGIGKENRRNISVAGSGGSQAYSMALNQGLKLKDAEIKNTDLVLANLSSLSSTIGFRLDGIVGYEILNQYVTQMDFDHKRLLLYNNVKSVDTTGYTGIPFEFSKNILIPRFPISIMLANGESFTGKVMFDTGNAFTLIVSTPFSKYHDFNNKLGDTRITEGRGMNATTQDQLANIRSMSFNGFDFGPMGIRLTVNEKAEPKDGYLGILGIEVIKHFNVILDYATKRIYLKPNQAFHDTFSLEKVNRNLSAESKAFLDKNKNQPEIKVTASGLQYKIIKRGNGPKPKMEDKVSLNFSMKLVNGKKLWSTYTNNKPWIHHLDKIFPGIKEAVLMMPEGSKWVVYVPSSLAFGDAGDENVPPGAALICELEVLKSEN